MFTYALYTFIIYAMHSHNTECCLLCFFYVICLFTFAVSALLGEAANLRGVCVVTGWIHEFLLMTRQ